METRLKELQQIVCKSFMRCINCVIEKGVTFIVFLISCSNNNKKVSYKRFPTSVSSGYGRSLVNWKFVGYLMVTVNIVSSKARYLIHAN